MEDWSMKDWHAEIELRRLKNMSEVKNFEELSEEEKEGVREERLVIEKEEKDKDFYNKKHGLSERQILNG